MSTNSDTLTSAGDEAPCGVEVQVGPDQGPAPALTVQVEEAWRLHRVMVFHGARDTRKGTKRAYQTVSLGEVFEMEHQAQPKDRALAMLQSSYSGPDGRTHDIQEANGSFVCLCLDIDRGGKSLEDVALMVDAFTSEEVASLIYSTASATPEQPKWRVIVALESAQPFGVWREASEVFFDFAASRGIEVDRSLARAGQPVYLPNVPPERRRSDGRPLLAVRENVSGRGLRMTDPGLAEWWAQREVTARTPTAATTNPLSTALRASARHLLPGPIDRFNAAHRIEDLMERYGYAPGGGVHWRSPLQTSDSYATRICTGSDGGQFWVSLSESDAAAGLGRKSASGARTGDAFDLFCHFEHGGDMEAALVASQEAQNGPQEALESDPVALDWSTLPEQPPEVPFVVPGWLPAGVVTLLAAHGGTGKSYLSIYIAICLATGRHPFEAGEEIERVRVVLYSAEDGAVVLQNRIVRYLRMLNVHSSDLVDWLEVLDATGSDNVLFGAKGITRRFAWVRDRGQRAQAQVLIFDNASDGFSGNEIDRAQVRQFMSALRQVAPTVLLLAHVDAASSMADMADAKGYSGSTGWHNSARSRWFMARDKKTDEIILAQPKVNYARAGAQVIICWDDVHGVFRVMETLQQARKAKDYRGILLGLLAAAIDAGTDVRPQPNSPDSAFKVLHLMQGFPPRLTQVEVNREVAAWLSSHLVRRETFTKANRHQAERLVLTDAGRALAVAPPESGEPPGVLLNLIKGRLP